jgi:peptidyl-prolyl cis-trans isomerase SurA
MIALLALFALLSLPPPASAKVIEQIIVAIDGEPYTLTNLKDYAKSGGGLEFPKGELSPIGEEDKEVLEHFITEKLVAAEIKRLAIKITEQDIDAYIAQIKERNKLSDADIEGTLRREGMSVEKYRDSIRAEIEKNEIINSQVRKKVNITSGDVERYYKLNSKNYMAEEKIHLRHILLALPRDASPEREAEATQRAMEIRRQIQNGQDFAQLARDHSEGAGAAEGGDIGWVGRGSLLKEIEEAARQLKPGTVSQPIRTSLGIHLIKLEGMLAAQPLPLSQVEGRIKEELYARALEERFQKWLKGDLRKRHRVDVKLPGVVFRAEESSEDTVSTLMSSARRGKSSESSFLSYLNPLSYIFSQSPADEDDPESGTNVVSLFGVPLFTTESDDDVADLPDLTAPDAGGSESPKSEESGGFFPSLWKTVNPFSD